MIHQFDHRWATYDGADSRDVTTTEHANPAFEPVPRYWVPEYEVEARLADKGWTRGWLMGWRDIARATDERTLISGIIPRAGVGDKFLLMHSERNTRLVAALYGCMNSLTCDFISRQKVGGTSFKYFTMKQLCVLPLNAYSAADLAFIVTRILELTYTSHAMASFARPRLQTQS